MAKPMTKSKRPSAARSRKGCDLLHAYLVDNEISAAEFARQIECAPSYISMLRYGKALPSIGRAKLIQVKTGGAVPADSWT